MKRLEFFLVAGILAVYAEIGMVRLDFRAMHDDFIFVLILPARDGALNQLEQWQWCYISRMQTPHSKTLLDNHVALFLVKGIPKGN